MAAETNDWRMPDVEKLKEASSAVRNDVTYVPSKYPNTYRAICFQIEKRNKSFQPYMIVNASLVDKEECAKNENDVGGVIALFYRQFSLYEHEYMVKWDFDGIKDGVTTVLPCDETRYFVVSW
jgi:hypothetical protein